MSKLVSRELSGWGRFPRAEAQLVEPELDKLGRLLTGTREQDRMIARGSGRSYGDSALGNLVISSRNFATHVTLDSDRATLSCGAGATLAELLKICVPLGWTLPVLPGTRHVSVGGAIAADIHGKNHHLDGSFCDHVRRFTLMLASGEVVDCSPDENRELFRATCGGMGLTGIIVEADLALEKISSARIRNRTLIARDLDHCIELIDTHAGSKYSVAWVDCLARGAALGRSVLYLGEPEQADGGDLRYSGGNGVPVPFDTPGFLLNSYAMTAFNSAYYHLKKLTGKPRPVRLDAYFFPLDKLRGWNRLYGKRGFLQYQFVLPLETASAGIREVLQRVSRSGKGSFLSVLKRMGRANDNLLSFPQPGLTLALDFKYQDDLLPLLDELDDVVADHQGRIYLAKDARMSASAFRAGYPEWEEFAAIKNKVDPQGRFASSQSHRLGLTESN